MDNQYQTNQQQYVPHQPQYSPVPGPYLEEPVSIKEWIFTHLILLIPIVNIIMFFVWAFGDGKQSKKNYFKAQLILAAIGIAIYTIIIVLILALGFSLMDY